MLTLDRIRRADRLRGAGRFQETPLHVATTLNRLLGLEERVHLKLELFQRTGSFKVRGAAAKVDALSPEERRDTADVPLGVVEIELTLETRGAAHAADVGGALAAHGFDIVDAPARTDAAPEWVDAERRARASRLSMSCR